MKIADVRTFVVGNPPPGTGGRYFIFVKLTTNSGVVGYGEAYNATFSAHVTARMIEDMAERYLVGRDPHDIENLFLVTVGDFTVHHPHREIGRIDAEVGLAPPHCASSRISDRRHSP